MTKAIFAKDLPNAKFEVFSEKPNIPLIYVKQVHGSLIKAVAELDLSNLPEADGLYTQTKETNLAIITADCVPIAIIGKKGHAHLHAGWRGIKDNIILQKEVSLILPTLFFLGPHIQSCCFEVSKDFTKNFPKSDHFKQREGKLFFDLALEVETKIKENYPQAKIEHSGVCTCCNENFHSFRRNKTKKRNWNILGLKL